MLHQNTHFYSKSFKMFQPKIIISNDMIKMVRNGNSKRTKFILKDQRKSSRNKFTISSTLNVSS